MHILIVEDDLDSRDILTVILEQEGHKITATATLAAAVAALRAQTFDRVILDLSLPDGFGSELLELVPPATRVLIVTATHPSIRQQRAPGGLPTIIEKPFVVEELLEAIRS